MQPSRCPCIHVLVCQPDVNSYICDHPYVHAYTFSVSVAPTCIFCNQFWLEMFREGSYPAIVATPSPYSRWQRNRLERTSPSIMNSDTAVHSASPVAGSPRTGKENKKLPSADEPDLNTDDVLSKDGENVAKKPAGLKPVAKRKVSTKAKVKQEAIKSPKKNMNNMQI